jgi:hypothetical protein
VKTPPLRTCVAIATSVLMLMHGLPASAQQGPGPQKLNIVIVEGDGAINNVRQRVAREPIVQVEDENRKPVAGALVTFITPNQGASATFADGSRVMTVTTDNQGRAVARGMRPNSTNGNYQIRVNASFQGQTATSTLGMTNALAATGALISGKLLAILAIGGAAAAGGAIAATRGNGNGNGRTPTTITPGTPTVGVPR